MHPLIGDGDLELNELMTCGFSLAGFEEFRATELPFV
jgi:hypothetical protein